MLPASLAADVPVFIATPTSAWARAGASLVPSPVIATRRPPSCSRLDQGHLVLGRGLGEEVVDAGLVGDRPRGERVVAGDHHGADAHAAHLLEPLAHPLLDDVLEVDHAQRPGRLPVDALGDDQRRAAAGGDGVDDAADVLGGVAAVVADPLHHRRGGALADLPPAVEVDAAHPGLRGERDEVGGAQLARRAAPAGRARSWPGPRSSGPRASRRPGWTAGRRPRARRRRRRAPATNSAACRLPRVMVPVLSSSSVLTSPAASTARPDMASTLCCTSRSIPAMPIADSSAPIVVGIRQTSSATSTISDCSAPE